MYAKLVCLIRGHRAARWFLCHSMNAGRHNGFDSERVHVRLGRCERCGELVAERYEPCFST